MVSAGHVNIPEICVKLFTVAITGFVSRVAMAFPLASKHCKAIVPLAERLLSDVRIAAEIQNVFSALSKDIL